MKKDAITSGDVHLCVSGGILYLATCDKVVEGPLRFCPKEKCVTNINRNNNNIRDLLMHTQIVCDVADIRTEEEEAIKAEGFNINYD